MTRSTLDIAPGLVVKTHEPTLIDRNRAVFSEDEVYRYSLTRRWDDRKPPAVYVMLNPSTASAFTDDPTIRRCVGFARSWGCGGVIVLNLYGLRATNPADLLTHPDPVGEHNDHVIRMTLAAADRTGPVIAAWGAHGTHLNRNEVVTDLLTQYVSGVQCLGFTKDGHPRHPLYMRGDATLVPYGWR